MEYVFYGLRLTTGMFFAFLGAIAGYNNYTKKKLKFPYGKVFLGMWALMTVVCFEVNGSQHSQIVYSRMLGFSWTLFAAGMIFYLSSLCRKYWNKQ